MDGSVAISSRHSPRLTAAFKDVDDLSFSAGDIIEVVKEENADWWMGRFNGKQALFPSAYVEKIAAPTSAAPAPAPAPGARRVPPISNANAGPKPAYRPFMAAHQGRDAPPAPGGGTNSLGLQQDPEQDKKKSKYSKYGDTVRLQLNNFILQSNPMKPDGTLRSRRCRVWSW
jgi:hypothetical protein